MTRKRALMRQNRNRSGHGLVTTTSSSSSSSSSSTRFGNDDAVLLPSSSSSSSSSSSPSSSLSSSTTDCSNNCVVCDRKYSHDNNSSYLPCGGCCYYPYTTIIQKRRLLKQQQQRPKMIMSTTIIVHFFLKTIPMFLIFMIIVLTVPKLMFDIARYSTMSRPALLYGTPTDLNDIKGCLSHTYRQEVRDYLNLNSNYNLNSKNIDDDVIWNWNRYSSTSSPSLSSSPSPSLYDKDSVVSGLYNNITSNTTTTSTTTTTTSTPRRRLLIAQYSGKGSYLRLLQEVEPINKAYAKKWGHDYITLVGTALKFPGLIYDHNSNSKNNNSNNQYCRYYNNINNTGGYNNSSNNHTTMTSSMTPSQQQLYYNYEAQSTFNKIPLLFKAMDESPQKYDQVLILDTDTMIVDFDYDITSLMFSESKSKLNNTNNNNNNNDDNNYFYRGSSVNEDTNANNGDENTAFDTTSRNDVKQDSVNDNDKNHSPVIYSDRNTNNMNDSNITNNSKNNNYNNNAINDDDETSNFLVAYRVWSLDPTDTWDVNAGITLWNLRHPKTRIVAEDWLKRSLSHPKDVLLKNDDQYYLQRSLQKITTVTTTHSTNTATVFGTIKSAWYWWKRHSFLPLVLNYYRLRGHVDGNSGIRAIRKEFEYYNATVVKHFKRDTASWSRTGLEQRLMRIKETKIDICKRWQC